MLLLSILETAEETECKLEIDFVTEIGLAVTFLECEWVQQSFVRNNVWACFIKHVYHNMFRLKSKPSSDVIEYRTLNVSYH
jgi:hypothetical protein